MQITSVGWLKLPRSVFHSTASHFTTGINFSCSGQEGSVQSHFFLGWLTVLWTSPLHSISKIRGCIVAHSNPTISTWALMKRTWSNVAVSWAGAQQQAEHTSFQILSISLLASCFWRWRHLCWQASWHTWRHTYDHKESDASVKPVMSTVQLLSFTDCAIYTHYHVLSYSRRNHHQIACSVWIQGLMLTEDKQSPRCTLGSAGAQHLLDLISASMWCQCWDTDGQTHASFP